MAESGGETIPHLMETGRERTYKAATKGAIDGVKEGLSGR